MPKPNRELFKAHLGYWKEKLHLGNYSIIAVDDYEGIGGECRMNHPSLVATISIGEVDEIWTEAVVARHEMLELLMEPFYAICVSCIHDDIAYRASHEIIHRLESILPLPSDKEVGYMGCGKKKKPKGK